MLDAGSNYTQIKKNFFFIFRLYICFLFPGEFLVDSIVILREENFFFLYLHVIFKLEGMDIKRCEIFALRRWGHFSKSLMLCRLQL